MQNYYDIFGKLVQLPALSAQMKDIKYTRGMNKLYLYARETTGWSQTCEADHETSRAVFYHEIVEAGLGNQT